MFPTVKLDDISGCEKIDIGMCKMGKTLDPSWN